ncbi:heterokaryon incompatibility protein-domain-containing protein [Cladorrhinum samala]|uniref:Heterokaryon incompatibility protein-domain-containing protein n=1 Tax=Cladorrhinum samala TaxID=585594 RepID=A0AAV9HHT7_9PEZI|nr:heterokaryon incompatibility protein-domain-containing protein [Cladorrhinum samala]
MMLCSRVEEALLISPDRPIVPIPHLPVDKNPVEAMPVEDEPNPWTRRYYGNPRVQSRWIHDSFTDEGFWFWDYDEGDTLQIKEGARTSWTHLDDDPFVVGLRSELLSNASKSGPSNAAASHPNYLLLRKWLQDCDHNHIHCHRPENENFWPKRTIFVGDPNKLTLIEERLQQEDYVVLSHCWGRLTLEEKERYCTTPENYRDRLQGLSYDELPKTFQDAVQVTRALQKQYLWIDALCIIQGPDGDWDTEAKTMADIFAGAYCTIAASSAGGWGDGFLKQQSAPRHIGGQDTLRTPTCTCNFDREVEEGALMKRAWVLQERVLSRRIIHFTAAHIFCECGDGVLCEQLIKRKPPVGKQYFLLDTKFPDRLYHAGFERNVDFVKFLFNKYSTSGLSYATDRDVAIYSLLGRMEKALRTEVRYGIFDCFFGSLLMWKRTDENKTAPISYKDPMPSWSWMAYPGGIDFVSDTANIMLPQFEDLSFADDRKALNVNIRQFSESCRVRSEEEGYSIINGTEEVGFLWFDVADRIEFKHCVVVGMREDYRRKDPPSRKTYYVLVVREKASGGRYERLAAGTVEAQYVSSDGIIRTLW